MQREWDNNEEPEPSNGRENEEQNGYSEKKKSQSSKSSRNTRSTRGKEQGAGRGQREENYEEQETCWDRLMDRLMPSHLEEDPLIKDPVRQRRMQ